MSDHEEPTGLFRLGVIPTLSAIIPLFLQPFLVRYPRVELVIEEHKTEDLITLLHAEALDAALAATPLAEPGLHEEALGTEALYAYLPPGDPLAQREAITQSALSARDLWLMPEGHCFRSQVLTYCTTPRRKSGPVRFESSSFSTLVRLVDEGMGATVLPALVVQALDARRRREQVRPLVRPTPVREIGLLTARLQLRHRVKEALATCVRDALVRALGSARRATVLSPRSAQT